MLELLAFGSFWFWAVVVVSFVIITYNVDDLEGTALLFTQNQNNLWTDFPL
jgi:hypothetical protein